jgi:hypothetical protein
MSKLNSQRAAPIDPWFAKFFDKHAGIAVTCLLGAIQVLKAASIGRWNMETTMILLQHLSLRSMLMSVVPLIIALISGACVSVLAFDLLEKPAKAALVLKLLGLLAFRQLVGVGPHISVLLQSLAYLFAGVFTARVPGTKKALNRSRGKVESELSQNGSRIEKLIATGEAQLERIDRGIAEVKAPLEELLELKQETETTVKEALELQATLLQLTRQHLEKDVAKEITEIRSEVRKVVRSDRSVRNLLLLPAIASILFWLLVHSDPFLPKETFEQKKAPKITGYVLSESGDSLIVLLDKPRRVVRADKMQIVGRKYCEGTNQEMNWTVSRLKPYGPC